MDTNEKTAVKIVRDCLTTAHESLPAYASCLYVASMPIIKAHGVDDATTRHMIVAAFRVAALRSRSVDYRSGFMPDVRVTRVHAFKRHAAVYCETNTGYHYKVECTPLCDTVSDWLTPCLMRQVDTFEWTDQGWDSVRRDFVNLV